MVAAVAAPALHYPQQWLRAWARPLERLGAFGGVPLRVEYEFLVEWRPGHDRRRSSGLAFQLGSGVGRVIVRAGTWQADALATLVHELAHVALGPNTGHGSRWARTFVDAVYELTGEEVRTGRRDVESIDWDATTAIDGWLARRGSDLP